jgi:predicted transposase YdaD
MAAVRLALLLRGAAALFGQMAIQEVEEEGEEEGEEEEEEKQGISGILRRRRRRIYSTLQEKHSRNN